MTARSLPARLLLAATLLAGLVIPAHAGALKCDVAPELLADESPMPMTAKALAKGQPVKIVAIGSATTSGMGASSPQASYPARLEMALRKALPNNDLTVINKGVSKETAIDMVKRMDRDVVAEKPTLVIWETGTVDAVRGIDVDIFLSALKSGVGRLRKAGADIMFVDPQYSARIAAMVNVSPYIDAMNKVGGKYDLVTFHRFDVMRSLADAGELEMDEKDAAIRTQQVDAFYDCMGKLVSRMITDALRR